jgi:serine phosphatase RsbU (regulator of sigma subunit)
MTTPHDIQQPHPGTAEQLASLREARERDRRALDLLYRVSVACRGITSERKIFDVLCRELQKVFVFDSCYIALCDLDRPDVFRTCLMYDEGLVEYDDHVSFGPLSGRMVRERTPILVADLNVMRATLDQHLTTFGNTSRRSRAWMGVPLQVGHNALGVIALQSYTPGLFTPADHDLLQRIGQVVAVALENAQLHQGSVARVEQELEIAGRIQRNLFPRALPQAPGITIAASARPARETGGDFYDVVPLDDGRRLGLLVGDASGKSIPGAMLMAIARSVARSEARDHVAPETVMRETNRWIAQDVPPRSFVALSYVSLDVGRRRMGLANAGQLSPLRRRVDGTIEELDVPGPTLPLGIRHETLYEALEVELAPGDTVVFFTDGLVEAHSPRREMFGFGRFEALVRELGHLPPEELIAAAFAAVDAFCAGAPQHDDMTMLVLRVEPGAGADA